MKPSERKCREELNHWFCRDGARVDRWHSCCQLRHRLRRAQDLEVGQGARSCQAFEGEALNKGFAFFDLLTRVCAFYEATTPHGRTPLWDKSSTLLRGDVA